MPNVFISYSHQDRESATEITRALADRHVPVSSDQMMREGAEWEREIEKAITEAKVLILCLSPSFLATEWAKVEIGIALTRFGDAPDPQALSVFGRSQHAGGSSSGVHSEDR